MWIDDLPVFGRVGFSQTYPKDRFNNDDAQVTDFYLITHRDFEITCHKNEIVEVKVSRQIHSDHYVKLIADTPTKVCFFSNSNSVNLCSHASMKQLLS